MKRTLSIKRESLAELTSEDLNLVHGAAEAQTQGGLCDSLLRCSLHCQWTFNTCETCYC